MCEIVFDFPVVEQNINKHWKKFFFFFLPFSCFLERVHLLRLELLPAFCCPTKPENNNFEIINDKNLKNK
jgi:hypothetical protein